MITASHLSYTYPGSSLPAVNDISFELHEGEILGFLGPSGAGKSTTQRVLIRLLRGFQGEVSLLGKPLKNWGHPLYEHIGVGFELPNHYPRLSALENLHFFASFFKRPVLPIMPLLERVGLAKDANKRVSSFSKGMKMRLNFVRAIMHDPRLIFLDEPTAGLDPANARVLKNLILEQRSKGKSIFLTTHQMHDAEELCDRVAFMVEGEIRLIDTPERLRMRNEKREVAVQMADPAAAIQYFPLEDIGNNLAFQKVLRSGEIASIHSTESSLESVFLEVTGRELI